MTKVLNLTGKVFGRLTVIKRDHNTRFGKARWLCFCKCGREIITDSSSLVSGKATSCGCKRKETCRDRLKTGILTKYGKDNPLWRGGIKRDQGGYVHIRMGNAYIWEHRLVAEMKLGRPLLPREIVHHINGVRNDNRPENLMIFPNRSEHRKHHAAVVAVAKERK